MIFDRLTENEKVYWLNYLTKMEAFYQRRVDKNSKPIAIGKSPRKQYLLYEANLFHKNVYHQIKTDLYPHVSKTALTTPEILDYSYDGANAFSFGYLIRDWSPNSEYNQYRIIHDFLEGRLKELGIQPEKRALFLGCGTGRYAVDLAHRYEQVDAFDASLFMIWSINYLKQVQQWEVLEPVQKNCRKIEDTVRRAQLEMTPEQVSTIQSKVNFFVAEASNIPLDAEQVNHIYSIYFTDVLPLKVLFEELNRLLAAEGLFVHFGPLEYFFDDEDEMLSAEEVRLFFEAQSYTILADEFLPTRHLFNPKSMRYRVYDNWFFIAQKGAVSSTPVLQLSDVLCLNNGLKLEAQPTIDAGKCTAIHYAASLGEKSYHLPEIIYELLLQMDANKSLEQLLQDFELVDLVEEDKQQLLAILQELVDGKFIKITHTSN